MAQLRPGHFQNPAQQNGDYPHRLPNVKDHLALLDDEQLGPGLDFGAQGRLEQVFDFILDVHLAWGD
ncbi:MAG: hypothetical protein MUC97_10295 [Bernardetiaceae bacterium]|nr:hypothetical protein [Bernardetiaceae bacterium]